MYDSYGYDYGDFDYYSFYEDPYYYEYLGPETYEYEDFNSEEFS